MQIGALSFRPYIYNTNMLSSRSLSRISPIGDDLLTSKTDFSDLTDEKLNQNPLRRGQTLNFMDILGMQMQSGRLNASRIMKSEEADSIVVPEQGRRDIPSADQPLEEENLLSAAGQKERASDLQFDRNLFQMQHAAQAYERSSMLFT